MRDVRIEDYIGGKEAIPAAEVRKMNVGEKVILYSFNRYGMPQGQTLTIVQSGKKKVLVACGCLNNKIVKQIADRDNQCYTKV